MEVADQPAGAGGRLPVPVVTAQVQQHDEPIVLSGLGTVEALNTASIQSQVTGVLEEVNFTEGQTVKKGDVLAKIDPRLYQAALEQAQGQLAKDTALHAQAESDLARYQKLGTENSIALMQVADQQFLVAQDAAAMKTDQGLINTDQTNLDYTTLRAPFDGVTGLLQVQIGNLIQPTNTTGIVVLTQVQPISVVFTLPSVDIASVQEAMARGTVQATVYDQSGKKQLDVGTLLAINNQATTTSGTIQLKAIFPNQAASALARDVRQCRPHDLSRQERADDPDQRAAAEQQRAIRLCGRRRQEGLGPAGRGRAAAACGRADLKGAAGRRDRRRAGSVPADARDPRRRDGAIQRAEPDDGQRRDAAVNLSSGFITRPIATALMMVAVVALGIVSYVLLPVAALPNIDTPTIQVTAQMPGADPQTMASSVATQLERQFGQIPGLSQMTSSSGTGFTSITLQFDRSRTVDSAAQDVQAAINATQAQLPISLLSLPIYRKTNPADTPILLISLTSDVLPIMTVSDYAYSVLAQKLSQVPGVGLVTVGGNESPAIRIQLNPAQLAAMNLDFETIRLALASLTVVQPTGLLYGGQQAVALQTNDQLLTTQGYDDAIVAYRNGGPIRIRDIGRAIKAPQDKTVAGWLNGKPAVLLAVFRTPGANVMSAVEAIKKALPQLRASLPPGIDVEIVSDRTQTIAASLADVRFTLLLTIALVVGVIALFLRRLWATVIPAISVPISIIGTFAVMYVLGYSLDNLSLMALTIAVGFVVDDAIVMVENIVRHIEGGVSPLQAALDGAGEIGFTILSISISLIAVFIPLFLMGGVVGLLFREFAVTVAVSIVVSVLVSLTLTPMLCAKLLPAAAHGKEGRVSRALEAFFTGLVTVYDRALIVALRHRRTTLGVMIATVAATGWLFVVIPKGFFPQQDTGIIMGVSEAAQDVSPDGMKERQQAILEIAARDPAVASAVGYIGPGGPTVTENDGRVFITLKPHGERNVTADQVIARLRLRCSRCRG